MLFASTVCLTMLFLQVPPGRRESLKTDRPAEFLFEDVVDAYSEEGYDCYEDTTEYNGGPFYKLDDACERFVGFSQICLDEVESATHHCKGIVQPADHGEYIGDDVYRRYGVESSDYRPYPCAFCACCCDSCFLHDCLRLKLKNVLSKL